MNCKLWFDTQEALDLHLQEYITDLRFKEYHFSCRAKIDLFSVYNMYYFPTISNVIRKKWQYTCSLCNKRGSEKLIKKHIAEYHNSEGTEESEKEFCISPKCDICDIHFKFKGRDDVMEHIKTHLPIEKCKGCGQKYEFNLFRGTTKHPGDTTFLQNGCDIFFNPYLLQD